MLPPWLRVQGATAQMLAPWLRVQGATEQSMPCASTVSVLCVPYPPIYEVKAQFTSELIRRATGLDLVALFLRSF